MSSAICVIYWVKFLVCCSLLLVFNEVKTPTSLFIGLILQWDQLCPDNHVCVPGRAPRRNFIDLASIFDDIVEPETLFGGYFPVVVLLGVPKAELFLVLLTIDKILGHFLVELGEVEVLIPIGEGRDFPLPLLLIPF